MNPTRLFTLSVLPVGEFRTRYSRWSGLFAIFDERYELAFAEPRLTPTEKWVSRARHIHFRRSRMMGRAGFSEDAFARLSRRAELALAAAAEFDVVFQLQTLFAAGLRPRPTVIYTDTTFARVWDEWPAWTPVTSRAAARFMQLETEVANRAHTVFTMSEHARRSFIDDYGCSADRVFNVGTAMALPPSDLADRRWTAPTALFVGVDFVRKGGPELLAAWPAVRRSLPGAQLIVVGPRTRPVRLPSGVRWLGRVDDRMQLARIYDEASLFVLPSRFDPMPWVLGEAMGHGLACVVTPSCGMPELVKDGITGSIVPSVDAGRLAETVSGLLADPVTLERMGRAGHAMVTNMARWTDVADRMAPRIALAAKSGSPASP